MPAQVNEEFRTAMKRSAVLAILAMASIYRAHPTGELVQKSLTKLFGSLAAVKLVRIPELLNQLCYQSQGEDMIRRDACYGCFYRASNMPQGFPMLLAISNCGDVYLNGTDFAHCQAYLKNATTALNNRVSATTIYCTFIECIRQVNKDALLRECVGEAYRMFPNFNVTDTLLAQLFVNTTACVLAKTRCSYTNPITGETQQEDVASKLHSPTLNTVFVNSDYDINIVQVPPRHTAIDVCAKYKNIEQANWPGANC